MRFSPRFKDQVAIVTGAANGIGRATVEIIAAEGGIPVAVDLQTEALDGFVREVEAAGGRAHAHAANALNESEVQAVVEATLRDLGRVDVLVNAVGGSTVIADASAGIDALSLGDWQKLLDFNLTGTFLFCHHVVPIMKRQRSGRIVNLSSIAGRGLSASSSAAYAAAKGGIIALTRKLSLELGPFGITCNAIAPCMTLSERIAPIWERRSEAQKAEVLSLIPLGRLPSAEEQARVVCFLASSDADFVTGQTIDVNGGHR
ncbi:MAG: SDR family oxidoreductase [Gammaproteobacteria bacterium]|nr:SDR family oxidoreductase [Gammaproteobacteria bacterium]